MKCSSNTTKPPLMGGFVALWGRWGYGGGTLPRPAKQFTGLFCTLALLGPAFRVPLAEENSFNFAWGEHERDSRWWDSPAGVAMPVVGLSHALQNSSLDCFAPSLCSGRAFESHSMQKRHGPVGHASFGAGGGTRTHTMSPSTDFESVTSTNSITPACEQRYYSRHGGEMQGLFFPPCGNRYIKFKK